MDQEYENKTAYPYFSKTYRHTLYPICMPSDLESVCAVSNQGTKFLAAESTRFDLQLGGRLFALEIDYAGGEPTRARVVATDPLPEMLGRRNPEDSQQPWRQVEGMTCIENEGQTIVFPGERERGACIMRCSAGRICISNVSRVRDHPTDTIVQSPH